MNAQDDWPRDPGVRILWRGCSHSDLHFGGIEMVAVGVFATIVLIAALGAASFLAANGDGFWPAALIGLGLAIFIGGPLYGRWERARSYYAPTNRRALVRIGGMNRSLESWPIPAPEALRFRPGPPDSVIFGTRRSVGGVGKPTAGTDAGFFRIDGGADIYALMPRMADGDAL